MTEGKIALRPGCWLEKIQLCSFCQWLLTEWLDRVGWAPGAAGPCRAAVPVSPWLERKVHLRLLTPALAKATEVAFFFFYWALVAVQSYIPAHWLHAGNRFLCASFPVLAFWGEKILELDEWREPSASQQVLWSECSGITVQNTCLHSLEMPLISQK